MTKVYLNPGHGDNDPGACAFGRSEATEVLKVALAVGPILKANGIEVAYTRTTNGGADAHMVNYVPQVNREGCDLFVSFHRNASGAGASGYETCVYSNQGYAKTFADKMNAGMSSLGFKNRGTKIRTDLYVLNSTNMPAVLMELGFIDSQTDNSLFDKHYNDMINLIAKSIMETLGVKGTVPSTPSNSTSNTSSTNKPSTSSPTSNTNSSSKTNKNFDVYYKVRTQKHGWLPGVKNLTDYAGYENSPITDIAIKVSGGSVKYRIHVLGGGWLPYVTGYNINDAVNGYAGAGAAIDAIEVYFYTPTGNAVKRAKYRVAPCNGGYYDWQYDNETGNGQDGYAGAFGVKIGKFQLCIE